MEVYYQPDLAQGVNLLTAEESRHCIKVLRHQAGDKITVVDGAGLCVEAEIDQPNPKACSFKVQAERQQEPSPFEVHIGIAPTKSLDRLEWFVEKCTEVGIQAIDFYISQNSERRKLKPDRLVRKAIAAMKQSGQAYLPEIKLHNKLSDLIDDKKHLDEHFIAYVDFTNPTTLTEAASRSTKSIVLIGPEGDFSEIELRLALESGYRKVSLGKTRLRTETAGLVACHTLNMINQ